MCILKQKIITPGGEALNIAANLSYRSDTDVYLLGMVGTDEYADVIKSSIVSTFGFERQTI